MDGIEVIKAYNLRSFVTNAFVKNKFTMKKNLPPSPFAEILKDL